MAVSSAETYTEMPARDFAGGRPRSERVSSAREQESLSRAFAVRAAPGGIPDDGFLAERANFAILVREDLKGRLSGRAGEGLASYLREAHTARRWLVELEGIAREVDSKVALRAAEALEGCYGRFESRAAYERWRGKALGFRCHVAEKILEAEEALRAAGVDPRAPAPPAPDHEDVLLRVRGYLIGAHGLGEQEREERRERLISLVSEALVGRGRGGPR